MKEFWSGRVNEPPGFETLEFYCTFQETFTVLTKTNKLSVQGFQLRIVITFLSFHLVMLNIYKVSYI